MPLGRGRNTEEKATLQKTPLTAQMAPLRLAMSRTLRPRILTRSLTRTAPSANPRKGFEDRNSINTEPTEYSKSGTDSAVAENEDAAFDPEKTRPEDEKKAAGKGNDVCVVMMILSPMMGSFLPRATGLIYLREILSKSPLPIPKYRSRAERPKEEPRMQERTRRVVLGVRQRVRSWDRRNPSPT
jgi:hypothetical protein